MSIHVSAQDGIATIALNYPPYNLLSNKVKDEITQAFREVSNDSSARVILFEVMGDHFCCGADLKEFLERIRTKDAPNVWDRGHEMLSAILNTPQPTVTCIVGNALGAGAELASAFDVRIFSENSRFGYPEVLRGVFPGNGGLERLIDLIGEGKSMPLLLSGQSISAEQALQFGLATELAPETLAKQRAAEYAQLLAANPGVAAKLIKRAVKRYQLEPSNFFNEGRAMFEGVHETQDALEAVTAFLEKRKPFYHHC